MPIEKYFGYIVGALIAIPGGALIVKYATLWIAGFRPSFTKALVSIIIACVIINLVGFAFETIAIYDSSALALSSLVSLGALSCCHFFFLRSDAGTRLSPAKAVLVALCQLIGLVISLVLVSLLELGIKRISS